MASFEECVPVILKHEGGWVSDPVDPGGETNFGISTLIIDRENISAEYLGLDPATHDQPGWLKPMTVEAAKKVYKDLFWDRYGYGQINDRVAATKVFDAAVNMGPGRAHRIAQVVLGVTADGILGPQTVGTLNAQNAHEFVVSYARGLTRYYEDLVAAKPQLEKFKANWLHRAQWGV